MKTIILALVCISMATQAPAQLISLKNGEKIILAIDDKTKTIVNVFPAEELLSKTIAAKKYPGCTFFTGILYGESSRSVRPIEFSDIKKRPFSGKNSKTDSRSVRPYEFSDIEKRPFLTISNSKDFSVVPKKDAILAFDMSQAYMPGGKFLFRDYVIEKPDSNFISGEQFLVMFDKKKKMILLKAK